MASIQVRCYWVVVVAVASGCSGNEETGPDQPDGGVSDAMAHPTSDATVDVGVMDVMPDTSATTADGPAPGCANVTTIPISECNALVALYNATKGDGWHNNDNWLVDVDPCMWFGVTCASGHVHELDLEANGLAGSLPPELGNLRNLYVLRLRDNEITGNIPPVLGSLTNLYGIWISSNRLSGSIPNQLGNLANLTYLWLVGNRLSGSIPPQLGNLTNLKTLNLMSNQLSGSIPPELGNLANLEYLWLGVNQLSGNIPPELGKLTSCLSLRLSNNALSGAVPSELMSIPATDDFRLHGQTGCLTCTSQTLCEWLDSKDPDWDDGCP